jgi:glutamate carboxypeptidase
MLSLSEFNAREGDLVNILKLLVEAESPSNNKAAVDRMGQLVAEQARKLGARVSVEPQTSCGDHILAHWDGIEAQPGFLILCHMDTVHPIGTLSANPCLERDGKLSGPGSLDMKAGIAILLVTMQTLKLKGIRPIRPVTALFTTDEEIGSGTSRELIEKLAEQAGLTLVLESALPNGALKTWRKGVGDLEIVVHGRAAHAGSDHALGRNAIEELAHQVLAIQSLTDYEKGTTLNVGVIQGGTVSNVVPEEAKALVDFRVLQHGEDERVLQVMHSLEPVLEGTSIEVRGGLNRPPMPRDTLMAETFMKAHDLAGQLGLELLEGGTGGGSDGNFVAALGLPALDGLGGWGEGLHSTREYVKIQSLVERAALLAAILTEWKI